MQSQWETLLARCTVLSGDSVFDNALRVAWAPDIVRQVR